MRLSRFDVTRSIPTLLFVVPVAQHEIETLIPDRHAECVREGFETQPQIRLFDGNQDRCCTRCGARLPS